MKVPFQDLHRQYQTIRVEINEAIQSVIDQSAFIRGSFVQKFEAAFAQKNGVAGAVGVANGTDALFIALKMLGVKRGDEVITTALSWISTSEVIRQAGATPVFVDVEPQFWTIDPQLIASHITDKSKAIIPVHLFGQACQMDQIMEICSRHALPCIEDTAQAHFSKHRGEIVGTFGQVGAFSFYPSKNLGAMGDAGAVISNDVGLLHKIRKFANHGTLDKVRFEFDGINSRLDGIQAAILSVKMKYIEEWNRLRWQKAKYYQQRLAQIQEIQLPQIRENDGHVFHAYVIEAQKRDELFLHLKERGIQAYVHYRTPLPLLELYSDSVPNHLLKTFPVATACAQRLIALPFFPEITEEEIETVAQAIKAFYR
jgi:dTDP-4-amino-4,6-dideoxygalactose transaminase